MHSSVLKILIIEDTPERQEILKRLTRNHAWILVHTVARANRLLDAYDFDLIFLDYDLAGEGSGEQIAVCIRKSRNRNARVIVHSMNHQGRGRILEILPDAHGIPISKIVRDNSTFKRFRESLDKSLNIDWSYVFKREKRDH